MRRKGLPEVGQLRTWELKEIKEHTLTWVKLLVWMVSLRSGLGKARVTTTIPRAAGSVLASVSKMLT
jgi:hypothetical protein